MAVTLAMLAKIETQPLKKYIIMNLLREIKVMEILPFENVDSLTSIAVRWRNLPSAAFRKIGGSYTASEGDTEQVWESVYPLGGEILYDRVFEKVKNTIVDMKKMQTDMKLLSIALTFNDYFINGDHGTDADGFVGLKTRVSNMPSRQTVYFAGASSAGLDPTSSTANGRAFIDGLEEMHYKTNRGEHNAFFCNEGIKWGVGRVLRYINTAGGNMLDVTKDSFERSIPTLWGSPIYDMGLKKDQSTEIITATESGGTGVANTTSVYAAAFNEQQGITGIQLDGLESYDPLNGGEQESTPAKMVRVEWWLGLAGFGSYGVVRGRNVESAGNWT
jgi:hypothetical protein